MREANNIWGRLENALLVVNFNSPEEVREFRQALKDNGLNINECMILAVVESKKLKRELKEQTSVVFIANGEFGFLGKLKNEPVRKVLSRSYDAILTVGDLPVRVLKLLKSNKTKMRIGINSTNPNVLINLESQEVSPAHLISFTKQTLAKIE